MHFVNGEKYDGTWKNNQQQGVGILHNIKGQAKIVCYVNKIMYEDQF